MATKKQPPTEPTKLSDEDIATINQAIAAGRELIEGGSTKVEASMIIYKALSRYPQETAVSAMIEGAGLTPKGALTYWYNCRRKSRG